MTSLSLPVRSHGRRRAPHRAPSAFSALSLLLAAAVIALTVVPLADVVFRLFYVDGSFTLEPVRHTLSHPHLLKTIGSTLIVVLASTVIATVIGGGLAWLNERTDARMGLLSDILPMVPFLVPPVAGATGWIMLLAPQAGYLNNAWWWLLARVGIHTERPFFNIYSWQGLIFVFSVYGVAFTYMMIAPALRTLDSNLEEQSRISGAGALKTHFRVTLPAILPSVAAGALLWIWVAMVTVDIPLVVGRPAKIDMLSTDIVSALHDYPTDRGLATGLSVVVAIVVLAVWAVQTRILGQGRHATLGTKGTRTVPQRLGRARTPVRILMGLYLLLTTLLPFGALLIVGLTGTWQPSIQWSRMSLSGYHALLTDPLTRAGLRNSIVLALVCATLVVLLTALISLYIRRTGGLIGRVVDAGIKLPSTLGALLLVVGIMLTFEGSPFWLGGTLTLLFLGYILLCVPNASIASDAAVASIGDELMEASAISGARDGITFRKVVLPLLIPGLVGTWAIVFVRVLSDVTVASLLAGVNNPVIGYQIINVQQMGTPDGTATLASVLTVISAVVLTFAVWFGRWMSRWAAAAGR